MKEQASTNGDIERAELEALQAAPMEEKMTYVVTCVYKTKKAVDAVPGQIASAIDHQRRRDRKQMILIATTVSAIVGAFSPLIIHYL